MTLSARFWVAAVLTTVPVSASWDFSVFVVVMFLSEIDNVGVSVMCNSRVIHIGSAVCLLKVSDDALGLHL